MTSRTAFPGLLVAAAALVAAGGASSYVHAQGPPAPTPTMAPAATYHLDPAGSRLFIMVYKDPDTIGAKLSHDHVVAARGWTGSIVWSPDDPASCKVEVSVPVSKLDPDPPALRKRAGFKRMLTDGDRADVKSNLLATDQLWASKHPTITFVSSKCASQAGAKVTVSGDLTIRGVKRRVKVKMKVGIDPKTGEMTASGSLVLRHTWFGFEPFSAMGGALKNKDEMRLFIIGKGKRG